MNTKPFSLLISVYAQEKAPYFDSAMHSIWEDQVLKPTQIVLVKDGPLGEALEEVIARWQERLFGVLTIVALEHNMGLGDALNRGLEYCTYELVARMDSDDIALPQRFAMQMACFAKHPQIGICGGWIGEFDTHQTHPTAYRKVPQYHDEIASFAKYRSPLNHASVMFKKNEVLKAGGYQKMLYLEDYYLWIRMIQNGVIFYNLQEVILHVRAGDEMLQRRRGWNYLSSEITLLNYMRRSRFLTLFEYTAILITKIAIRLMPKSALKQIYTFLRHTK